MSTIIPLLPGLLEPHDQLSIGAQHRLVLTMACSHLSPHLLTQLGRFVLNSDIWMQELQEDFAFSLHQNEDLSAKLELSAQALPPYQGDNGSMQQSEEPKNTFQVSAEAPQFCHANGANMQSHPASEPDQEPSEHQNLSPQETSLQQPLAPAKLHTPDPQHESPVLEQVRARYFLSNMDVTSAFRARMHWDLHLSRILARS